MKRFAALALCFFSIGVYAQSTSFRTSGCFNEKWAVGCTDSIKVYNDSIKTGDTSGYYYYQRGRYQLSCRDFKAAILSCDTAASILPNKACVYYTRSTAYQDIGRLRDAYADALMAVQLDSMDSNNWCHLAVVCHDFGLKDSSIMALNKSLALNPKNYVAICDLSIAYLHQQKYKEALAEANRAMAIDSNAQYAYYARSFVYYYLGKYKQSIADIDKIFSTNPCNTELYYHKALCYDQMKKTDSAIYWYTIAIEKYPGNYHAYYDRALQYEKKKEMDKAGEDFLQSALLGYSYAVDDLRISHPAYYTKYLEQRKK